MCRKVRMCGGGCGAAVLVLLPARATLVRRPSYAGRRLFLAGPDARERGRWPFQASERCASTLTPPRTTRRITAHATTPPPLTTRSEFCPTGTIAPYPIRTARSARCAPLDLPGNSSPTLLAASCTAQHASLHTYLPAPVQLLAGFIHDEARVLVRQRCNAGCDPVGPECQCSIAPSRFVAVCQSACSVYACHPSRAGLPLSPRRARASETGQSCPRPAALCSREACYLLSSAPCRPHPRSQSYTRIARRAVPPLPTLRLC